MIWLILGLCLLGYALILWVFAPPPRPEGHRLCAWVCGGWKCRIPTEGGRVLCRHHRELLRRGTR